MTERNCNRFRNLPALALAHYFVLALVLACIAAAPPARGAETNTQPSDSDPDLELLERMQRGFQKLAKRVAPCVVSLHVEIDPFNHTDEWRRMIEQFGAPLERKSEGSGVIVDPQGYIITNEHVVHAASRIMVTMMDGRVFSADTCGSDPRSDLAMIKLTGEDVPKDLTAAVFTDSDKIEAGQWVMAIGNPFGLSNTVTFGIISAKGRSMPPRNFPGEVFYGNLIQTDATINPGNSGGPLFDIHGKLLGINTVIFSHSGLSERCGFAIPSNHLKPRLAELKAGLEIQYGWLGVKLGDLIPGQNIFKVPDNKGVRVEDVIPNTPADRAGLQRGMVIVNFDGVRIGSSQELIAAVNETAVGRKVKVQAVDRSGKMAEFDVRISKRYSEVVASVLHGEPDNGESEDPDMEISPDAAPATTPSPKTAAEDPKNRLPATVAAVANWRGMQLKELSLEDGRKRGGRLEIVRIKKGSPADRAGLYEGAIVTELKSASDAEIKKFNTLEEFKHVASEVSGAAAVYTRPDGYLTVEAK